MIFQQVVAHGRAGESDAPPRLHLSESLKELAFAVTEGLRLVDDDEVWSGTSEGLLHDVTVVGGQCLVTGRRSQVTCKKLQGHR